MAGADDVTPAGAEVPAGAGGVEVPAGAGGVVAILGLGVMGEAVLTGLLRGEPSAEEVLVSGRNRARTEQAAQRHGVPAVPSREAAGRADTVLLAVKPQDMPGLLDEIADALRPGTLVVSLAAGTRTAQIEARLPAGTPVARVMPNTPALVDEGMAAVSPGAHCTPAHLARVEAVLGATGRVMALAEKHQDAVTAISGSGPAYIFYVVESMIEAGVLLGLTRSVATELVVQTLFGAATMLKETGQHPTVLREQVSSPGGTTVAALRQLEDHKVRAAFLTAMEAAAIRSRELSAGASE